ncbi:TPA: MBL fold metallo-hydrolase [Vibrio parahaemolyticus]|nr:MBL fold metallo-hydrolase [Vibrio parahaemolyticus]
MNFNRSILLALLVAVFFSVNASANSNEIHVLYSGYVKPIEGKSFLPGAKPDGARLAGSTISLIKGQGVIIVSDPGMTAPGDWNKVIKEMKSKHKVKPEDVTHVFISHHHPDHITRLGVFENATVIDHWGTYKDDVWADHPDWWELAPGIKVVSTPGHTHEDASLLVETDSGTYALTHLWWSPDYEPKEDPLAEDAHELEHSREIILKYADWIVPGHGDMFKNTMKK